VKNTIKITVMALLSASVILAGCSMGGSGGSKKSSTYGVTSAASPSAPIACGSNDDCSDGQICSDANVCVAACTNNDECSSNEECVSGQCEEIVADDKCTDNTDCTADPAKTKCKISTGACVACLIATDCDASGYNCTGNACVAATAAVCTATSQCLNGQYCSLSPIPSATNHCEQLLPIGNTTCAVQGQCAPGGANAWCYYANNTNPHLNPPSGLTGTCKASTDLLVDGAFCTAGSQCTSLRCGSDGKCGGAPSQSCSAQTGSSGCRTGYYCNLWTTGTTTCVVKFTSNQNCIDEAICKVACRNGYYCDESYTGQANHLDPNESDSSDSYYTCWVGDPSLTNRCK
jgi:hypothetical protein